jgi:isopentenyl phosphate kinase
MVKKEQLNLSDIMSTIILKLGGSSITKKADNKFEMDYEILKQSAQEIKNAIEKNTGLKIILVCGVGPFGHTNVVNYNLNGKIETSEQEAGVKKTKTDCEFVGNETRKALEKVGLCAKLILGTDVCVQNERKVVSFNLDEYKKCLDEGIISITTGTMVPDQSFGWSVMSGDQVIAQTAKYLNPEKVLMGTDVDGIYTADPKVEEDAKLIKEITKENLGEVLAQCGESKSVDVTGGMKGKLEKLASTLNGVPAEIFSLLNKGNLENALLKKEIKSTKINL